MSLRIRSLNHSKPVVSSIAVSQRSDMCAHLGLDDKMNASMNLREPPAANPGLRWKLRGGFK